MTTTRLPKTITAGALLATPIPPNGLSPATPGRAGNFCRSQQGGQKLADTVALLADFAGKSVWGREIEPRTVLISGWKIHWVVCKSAFTSLSMQKKTRNVSSCRRKVTELGRDWKNKSSVSSILTPILASSSSIPCKRYEKATRMVVCMPMTIRILAH